MVDLEPKTDTEVPPFRIEIKVRNNRIIRAREKLGYANASEAAKALKVHYHHWVQYESMAMSPLTTDGEWKESAKAVADAIFADPDDLWPDEALRISKTRATIEVTFEQMVRSFGDVPEHRMLVAGDRSTLEAAIGKLTKREIGVLHHRIVREEDLEEVGKRFDLSRTRIMQIQARAIEKLRRELDDSRVDPSLLPTPLSGQPRCEGCNALYNQTFRSFQPKPDEFHYVCGECWGKRKR
jgi:RNA polymerase sigma factor (sigma-70 family)